MVDVKFSSHLRARRRDDDMVSRLVMAKDVGNAQRRWDAAPELGVACFNRNLCNMCIVDASAFGCVLGAFWFAQRRLVRPPASAPHTSALVE
jgi:hypothetical protein